MRIIKKILNSAYKRKNTFFGSGFSVEKSYGCKWLIDWSNSVDKKMTFKLFEDKQIAFFIKNYKIYNPEYFLDIGAHGGLYSIILKKNFPKLNVLSFEPDRQNRFQLYGNLFLNKFEREIEVLSDRVRVTDRLSRDTPFRRLSVGSDATSIYVANSLTYQESRLCPWQHADWGKLPIENGQKVWVREYFRGSGHSPFDS